MKYDLGAWELITGSADGGISDREMCADIIHLAGELRLARVAGAMRQLATTNDEYVDPEDYTYLLDDARIPPSCSICFEDNELRVRPFIDDEIPRLNDYPTAFTGEDVIYIVNDHGNVTCQVWDGARYVTAWDMV